ncbi:MAG: sialidase, partial [Patescibacteria group bacterium]|nr:sialidase [Patescibacteria group bacterium]
LVRAGDRSQAAVLLEILAREDSYGHVHAAESLFKVGEVGDGASLQQAMTQTENLPLRVMGAAALARSGNAKGLSVLREILADRESAANRLAAWALAQTGNAWDIAQLHNNLPQVNDPPTRLFYEMGLANLGDPAGQGMLLDSLKSDEISRRVFAANFAGEGHVIDAADRLTALLDDPVPDVRYRAAQSLLMLDRPGRTAQDAAIP